jgi:beta-carotene 3-hydroxylase
VSAVVALVTFIVMEPVTYLVHRYVMHGPGMAWHASHHGPRRGSFERNDLFPLTFAVSTIGLMTLGALVPRVGWLVPIGVGVTAYGLAYLFVHDVYAHRRVRRFRARWPVLERLAAAHRLHHRDGGEPFGFLAPGLTDRRRQRAAR